MLCLWNGDRLQGVQDWWEQKGKGAVQKRRPMVNRCKPVSPLTEITFVVTYNYVYNAGLRMAGFLFVHLIIYLFYSNISTCLSKQCVSAISAWFFPHCSPVSFSFYDWHECLSDWVLGIFIHSLCFCHLELELYCRSVCDRE